MGTQLPLPKGGGTDTPQFLAHVYCGQTAGWIKMPLGMEVGLGPGHIVLDGDPAPPQKGGTSPLPQFSAHVYCGQTVGWIKMALDMEIGLGPGYTVLSGDPAPLPQEKGAQPPIFDPCLLWPNCGIDQDGTWYAGRPQPIVLHGDPAPPPKGGTAPNFRPMSTVAKRLDG